MAQPEENAMTWGERTLDKEGAGSVAQLVLESRKYLKKIVWILAVLGFLVIVLPRTVIFVQAGHGGVKWIRFGDGTVHQPALSEGTYVIWPWNYIHMEDLRERDFRHEYLALSNDGLPVKTNISLRYRLNASRLSHLYQDVGEDYDKVLLEPVMGSIAREVLSRYRADELYAFARRRLEVEIKEVVSDYLDFGNGDGHPRSGPDVKDGFLFVQDIAMLGIDLPNSVISAIESKMTQDQVAQEYEFRLKKETMEAERKDLEVKGIENYRRIATAPWFRDYMKFIEIQSNYKIAESPNAKLVFMGNSGIPSGVQLNLDEPKAKSETPAKDATPGK